MLCTLHMQVTAAGVGLYASLEGRVPLREHFKRLQEQQAQAQAAAQVCVNP